MNNVERVVKGSGRRRGGAPFLCTHAEAVCSIDFLTVETLSFQRLYAFVVLGLHRRKILHIEVTEHPTATWLAHQITEAFPWDEARPWLIRDNDRAGFCFWRVFFPKTGSHFSEHA